MLCQLKKLLILQVNDRFWPLAATALPALNVRYWENQRGDMNLRAFATLTLLLCWSIPAQPADDEDEIRRLIVESYVEGVYVNRDEQAVQRGFHPDFVLHINRDGRITTESLSQWLKRLDLDGIKSNRAVDYSIEFIDVTGKSAVAKLLIYLDSKLIYTDYFGFYKFEDGWLFINKIFSAHE